MENEELEELAYSVNDLINILYNAPDEVTGYIVDAIVNGDIIDAEEFIGEFGEPEDFDEEEQEEYEFDEDIEEEEE